MFIFKIIPFYLSVSKKSISLSVSKLSLFRLLKLCHAYTVWLKLQAFEYILSMAAHFLPKGIDIVFVYINSNTLVELPTNALLLCGLSCFDYLLVKVFVCCHVFVQLILNNSE